MKRYPCLQMYGWCLKGLGVLSFIGLTLYAATYVESDPVGAAIVIVAAGVGGLGMAAMGEGLHALVDMSLHSQISAEVLKLMYQKRNKKS